MNASTRLSRRLSAWREREKSVTGASLCSTLKTDTTSAQVSVTSHREPRMQQGLTKQLCDIRDFVVRLRAQMRFGRLSRASLRLLRLEWRGEHVECDWVARSQDDWDQGLPGGDRNTSLQALEDAIEMRDLLFFVMKDISSATFRVY